MNNILVTTSSYGSYDKRPIDYMESRGYKVIFNPLKRKLTENEAIDLITKYQPVGIIAGVEPITARVLENTSNLRAISRCGIGMDNVDIQYAKEHCISVINTPDGPTIAVAELTVGLMISLLRRIHISDASIRDGRFLRPMGNLLSGKSIGIIGCGRIGSKLAELLIPFGCTILGYDPFIKQSEFIEICSFENLLAESDIVSLHLPYNSDTRHILNEATMQKMKKGAFLVNASRGGLVDENALYKNIKNNRLSGASLDCFEKEPYEGDLCSLSNVLLTGHIGSYAIEGRIRMELKAAENLIQLLLSTEK